MHHHIVNQTYLHNATLPSDVQCCNNKTTRNPFKKQYSMLSEKTYKNNKKYILQNNPSLSQENTLYFLSFLRSRSNVKCECVHHRKTHAECVDCGWLDSKLGPGREGNVSR